MSKTTQENKKKVQKEQQKVEVQTQEIEQKAVTETKTEPASIKTDSTPKKVKPVKIHSKKYLLAKKKIDITKYYPLKDAIKLVKETSLSKFDGKIEAHITILDIGTIGEITFPHLQSISKKVVILNDAILAEIKDGKTNFDILVTSPTNMPKLLPFAKILGPKGLMPNLKNGTITEDTETVAKNLSIAKTIIKTEKKAPVIHIVVGKVSQSIEELFANINELISVIKPNKIKKLALCATIGPCVKVKVK